MNMTHILHSSRRSYVNLVAYAILGVVLGGILTGASLGLDLGTSVVGASSFGPLKSFRSYDELRGFLETHTSGGGYYEFQIVGGFMVKSSASAVLEDDFSRTNVQVEGVDEADIVKTDGEYIYLAEGNSFYIVKAYPASEAQLISKTTLDEEVMSLYIAGDKLVVFSYSFGEYVIMRSTNILPSGVIPPIVTPPTYSVSVKVYDVSDRASPRLEREFRAEGGYMTSRMIGDYVYAVVQKGAWVQEGKLSLPIVEDEGRARMIDAREIYYVNDTDQCYSYTTVLSLNTQNPLEPVSTETLLLGASSTIYVSLDHMYITAGGSSNTTIHKIRLQDGKVTYLAEGEVPGWVLNQFSMDESGGYFRIATTGGHVSRSSSSSSSAVYVLDESMRTVGVLEGLAPGEQIYSARFMGDRCYLVTFKKVDPLFVIDLSNPSAPTVLGKLKIPGYSNYLHPYDETHVIGIGKETVEAEEGDFAWYQGLKISLFDVSDVANPVEVAKIEVGDRGTDSPALQDHKAFLFSREKGIIVLPILEAKIDAESYGGNPPPNAYGEYVYQGAYVFDIGIDGISLRGRVTHIPPESQDFLKSGYWFNSEYSVERSLYISDTLYTISGRLVKANSLADLSELASVELK
jgi:inhibitor of cysteine peptidase